MEKKNIIEIAVLTVMFIFMLWLWMLPVSSGEAPYGETDAAIHYYVVDSVYQRDNIAIYEREGYGFNSSIYDGYPPPFHYGISISELLSDRYYGFYTHVFLLCSLIFFTLYFFMRKMYGIAPAMLSCVFMIFSLRNIFTFLWGQWATLEALAIMPIIFYTIYKSYSTKELKYTLMLGILLSCQFLAHAAIMFLTLAILFVYTILIAIKHRKIPFDIKHMILAIILCCVIFSIIAPLQVGQMVTRVLHATGAVQIDNYVSILLKENPDTGLSRIFGWYNLPFDTAKSGYPAFIFQYDKIYYGWWTLFFLVIGIILLLIRRSDIDLMLLSSLIGFYIMTHTDIFFMLLDPKIIRLFYAESILFVPLICIGICGWNNFFNLPKKWITYIPMGLAALFIVYQCFSPTYSIMSDSYNQRLNPYEMDAANWIIENTDYTDVIVYLGIPSIQLKYWFQAASNRPGVFDLPTNESVNYLIKDYSWYKAMGMEKETEYLQNLIFPNLVYTNGFIDIYEVKK